MIDTSKEALKGGKELANYNVLVVDDEKEIRDAIEIYLKNEGVTVLKAKDGIEALEILHDHEVHLIILDVMMPRLDGISATHKIREQKNIPIIILSAKTVDTDKIIEALKENQRRTMRQDWESDEFEETLGF